MFHIHFRSTVFLLKDHNFRRQPRFPAKFRSIPVWTGSWLIQTRSWFWRSRRDGRRPRRRNSPWAKSTRPRCRPVPGRCCWVWMRSWTRAFSGCWSWAEQTWNRNGRMISFYNIFYLTHILKQVQVASLGFQRPERLAQKSLAPSTRLPGLTGKNYKWLRTKWSSID